MTPLSTEAVEDLQLPAKACARWFLVLRLSRAVPKRMKSRSMRANESVCANTETRFPLAQPPLIAVLKSVTLLFVLVVAAVTGAIAWWILEAQELSAVCDQVSPR